MFNYAIIRTILLSMFFSPFLPELFTFFLALGFLRMRILPLSVIFLHLSVKFIIEFSHPLLSLTLLCFRVTPVFLVLHARLYKEPYNQPCNE